MFRSMCWSVYIASSKPLPTGPVAGGGDLRLDPVTPEGEQPMDEGMSVVLRYFSLPCAYYANVGAPCGFSCGVDDPDSRSQLRALIREQMNRGNRIEILYLHVDYELEDLEFTVKMTPEELPDARVEHRIGDVRYDGGPDGYEYDVVLTDLPLEGHDIESPRLIQFVNEPSESTYASLDPRVVRPGSFVSYDPAELRRTKRSPFDYILDYLAGDEVIPRKVEWILWITIDVALVGVLVFLWHWLRL